MQVSIASKTGKIRRHRDGSINLGFYEGRAVRRRTLVQRVIFRRCIAVASRALSKCAVPIAECSQTFARSRVTTAG